MHTLGKQWSKVAVECTHKEARTVWQWSAHTRGAKKLSSETTAHPNLNEGTQTPEEGRLSEDLTYKRLRTYKKLRPTVLKKLPPKC